MRLRTTILGIVCFILSFMLEAALGGLGYFVLGAILLLIGTLVTGGLLGWAYAEDYYGNQKSQPAKKSQ